VRIYHVYSVNSPLKIHAYSPGTNLVSLYSTNTPTPITFSHMDTQAQVNIKPWLICSLGKKVHAPFRCLG